MLPGRLLSAFETKVAERGCGTKAATIAALLEGYLPQRTDDTDSVRAEIHIPADVFDQVYKKFGPGPVEDVLIRALTRATQGCAANEEFMKEAR